MGPEHPPERIHFLDIGAGKEVERAKRLAQELARRGERKRIVAVDVLAKPEEHAGIENLEVHGEKAESYLARLPNNHVDHINFDLSLSDPEHQRQARKQFPWRPPKYEHVQLTPELANQLKKVLHQEGRITVNGSLEYAKKLAPRLRKAGFKTMIGPLESMPETPQFNEGTMHMGRSEMLGGSRILVATHK